MACFMTKEIKITDLLLSKCHSPAGFMFRLLYFYLISIFGVFQSNFFHTPRFSRVLRGGENTRFSRVLREDENALLNQNEPEISWLQRRSDLSPFRLKKRSFFHPHY